MKSGHDKKRMTAEGDRLSNLPDDLIHKILALIRLKSAIRTSFLSSRWRYIWTSMPCLNLASEDLGSSTELDLSKFSEFVTHVLSARNNEIEVSSVMLTFRGNLNHAIFERSLNYAFTHNVQQLNITCLGTKSDFPLSLFCSQSLKHLTLKGDYYGPSIMSPPTWELPALATLNLDRVTLCDESTDTGAGLFTKFANLKNLTLKNCRLRGSNGFNICHPGLSSLTLEDGCKDVNVLTPQLKNLTVKNCRRIHLISAPNLSALYYKDYDRFTSSCSYFDDDNDDDYYQDDPLLLSTELLHLEKVHMCIDRVFAYRGYNGKVVCLLQQLRSVKFLTLNMKFVKLLSSSVELISHQPSPFVNLKSLKLYPAGVTEPEVTMSSEVKNYFLDSSPSATVTMVSHEELRAVMNVTSARNLINELHVLLDEWKENSVTNTTHMRHPMATHLVENHRVHLNTKMKLDFGERVAHIKSYWEDMNEQFKKGYKNASRTTSLLQKIEEVLRKLPPSCRALTKLQAKFSNLCAEADTIMDSVMDRMMIQCDKKPSRSNVFFHEFATSSHPTSS